MRCGYVLGDEPLVALGSLVDEPTLKPTAHIFAGSKGSWYDILDDLPQHEEYEMQNAVGAMTLFVADKDAAKEFYARTFAVEPLFEDEASVAFRFENTVVNLVVDPAELIAPAAAGSGTTAMYTLFVDDCDAAAALVRSRGVELLNGPVDRPWGVRTATFADPDGHAWELAQPFD